MRREASFIRKGGCPSGSQTSPESVYICTPLSSSIFQRGVTGSLTTCLGDLDAVSIPGNCPQKKKISRGNNWVIIQQTQSCPLIPVYSLFQWAPSPSPYLVLWVLPLPPTLKLQSISISTMPGTASRFSKAMVSEKPASESHPFPPWPHLLQFVNGQVCPCDLIFYIALEACQNLFQRSAILTQQKPHLLFSLDSWQMWSLGAIFPETTHFQCLIPRRLGQRWLSQPRQIRFLYWLLSPATFAWDSAPATPLRGAKRQERAQWRFRWSCKIAKAIWAFPGLFRRSLRAESETIWAPRARGFSRASLLMRARARAHISQWMHNVPLARSQTGSGNGTVSAGSGYKTKRAGIDLVCDYMRLAFFPGLTSPQIQQKLSQILETWSFVPHWNLLFI